VSALLAKAVAEVLNNHPIHNAAYDASGAIKYNKDINIAMAVAIDGGLITPTIVRTSEQDLFAVSRAWKDLVARAKAKKLTPAEYSSGTIQCPAMHGKQRSCGNFPYLFHDCRFTPLTIS
jgi:pyruvate dehydrogenase E2 component (dihydrolipoamide acetyltransferase)